MSSHKAGLHHHHKRKRTIKHKDNKMVNFLDKFMYVIAIVMPLTTIPQIVQIWGSKSAENISIITWGAYVFSAVCWLVYSSVHKEKVLMINSILWMALNASVVVGIFIYG